MCQEKWIVEHNCAEYLLERFTRLLNIPVQINLTKPLHRMISVRREIVTKIPFSQKGSAVSPKSYTDFCSSFAFSAQLVIVDTGSSMFIQETAGQRITLEEETKNIFET